MISLISVFCTDSLTVRCALWCDYISVNVDIIVCVCWLFSLSAYKTLSTLIEEKKHSTAWGLNSLILFSGSKTTEIPKEK